jgi:Zn-dependent protease with chaperone function
VGADARAPLLERLAEGRPTNFPSVAGWLKVGIFRNMRGVMTALIAAWLNLPLAVALAVVNAVLSGVFGLVGAVIGFESMREAVAEIPVVGEALANLLTGSGGVLLPLLAVFVFAVLGFVLAGLWVFVAPFQEGTLEGISTLVGAVVGGLLVGLLYTVYRVVCERWLLRITGARRLSRREAELLLPIVRECAARLGLTNHPPVLIDDTREANALAYTRHIVINQGLLEEFNYDREAIAAVVSHELVHWRNGDPISAVFVRGVALPLYLPQAGAGWLLQRAGSSVVLRFLVWAVFWPVFITVKYVVLPMQAADARQAEYRADQGAVLVGHRVGMRRVLNRFRQFESGRNGWVAAVCATHPPNELRLERLEEPGGHYPLPDEEAPPLPIPVVLGGRD